MTLVSYTDGTEVLVCTLENEADMIREWFVKGLRTLTGYEREVHKEGVVLISFYAKVRS